MSGIAGIHDARGGPVDSDLLEHMTTVIAHRGPEGSARWARGEVGLGHRRRAGTEGGVAAHRGGDLRLTFDGRIDNGEELRAVLATAAGAGDAELVLAAYERFGPRCVERLLGDFAFALWDGRRRTLFCARDPLGVKPLYYHFDGGRLLIGSEPRQILQGVDARPNLALLARYLTDDYTERRETLYRGVHRLEPAHSLTAGPAGIEIRRYWDVDPLHQVRCRDDAEYDARFSTLFREAVAARLAADGPVGALLSGGLDSSSIVCTASDLYTSGVQEYRGLETWSVLFDTLPCDEREYIAAVVRRCGFHASFVHYENEDRVPDLDSCREHPEVLYAPITAAVTSALADAHDKGIRVMLSGTGGDEFLASGFEHLTDLLLAGRFRTLFHQLRCDADLCATSAALLFREHCLKPLIPRRVAAPLRRLRRGLAGNGEPDWLVPGVLDRRRLDPEADGNSVASRFATRSQRSLHRVLLHNSNLSYAIGENDLLASRFGIEYRYPFLDRRVVEFLIAIPERQRWWMDRPKAILRRALRDVLPEEVRERRTKAEFSVVLDREVRGRLAAQVEKLIRDSVLVQMGVVDRAGMLRRFRAVVEGRDETASRWAVFNFIGLELWSRSIAAGAARGGAA